MNESTDDDNDNNVPPLEHAVVLHEMVVLRKTPVYVDGRLDDEN